MSAAGAGGAGTRWPVITLLVACGIIAAAHMFKLSPALPFLRGEFGLSLVAGGWLFSLTNVIAVVIGIAAGSLVDRLGYSRMLRVGLAILAVAALLGSAADTAWLVFLARFLEGVGGLSVVIAAPSLIAQKAEARDQAAALTLWGIFNPTGGALVFLGGPLLLAASGWRALWLALTVLTLIILLAAVRIRPGPGAVDVRREPAEPMLHSIALTMKSPGPWIITLAFVFYTLQYSTLMAWLPSVMIEEEGVAVTTAGALAALVIAVNIIGNLMAGALLHRGVPHGALIIATAILMAVAAAIIFSPLPAIWRYAGCVALSLFGGILPGSVFAAVPKVSPKPGQLGTVNGLVVQGSNLGQMLGPPLAALTVTAAGDWNALLVLFLAASAATAVFGLLLLKRPAVEERR